MSDELTRQGSQPSINLDKKIVPFEQEGPEEEPLFANHFQVAYHGDVAYIDVGVIPLDDIMGPRGSTVRFVVLNRLVMGLSALRSLRDQITSVIANLGEGNGAPGGDENKTEAHK
ncbi:MAG TPA: hypothetical protein VG206_08135 [Terriglobia bacterium]|nr:hypothetical protein [Terriglobia bacterium]